MTEDLSSWDRLKAAPVALSEPEEPFRVIRVHADHKSLEWLQSTRIENIKVERWVLRLQEFHFVIEEITEDEKPVKAYVVLMMDYFTKAAEVCVAYSKQAVALYYGWFCRNGCCEFVKAEFKHQLQWLGIQHIHTSACHPAANGASCVRPVRAFSLASGSSIWVFLIPQLDS